MTDQAAGTARMKLVERPEPDAERLASLSGANYGDVVVEVHASGFTGNELEWPSTWTDRLGRDRTPSIPGHELAGVVTALSYGTTGLSVRTAGVRPHGLDARRHPRGVCRRRGTQPCAAAGPQARSHQRTNPPCTREGLHASRRHAHSARATASTPSNASWPGLPVAHGLVPGVPGPGLLPCSRRLPAVSR